MDTKPVWQKLRVDKYPQLKRSERFDVVVVGAGITGLTAGYLLKKSGQRVAVVDRGRVGSGETGHTSAHLSYITDIRLGALVKSFGKQGARLAWQGGAAAINTMEQIASSEQIDCGFRRLPAFLHAPKDADDEAREFKAEEELAIELGLPAAYLDAVPYFEREGVRYAEQARFHPLAYLAGLARAIDGGGSAVFENSEITDFAEDGVLTTKAGHHLESGYLVIATHVPVMGKANLASASLLQTKLALYSSYVVGATAPAGLLPEALFYDTCDPYHYLRVDHRGDHDYLIFGGEDHKTGQDTDTAGCFARLESKLRELVPRVRIQDRWSGQVVETNDGLPFIGETADRQFSATGFAGNGLTFGTLAAMMACDAVLERDNPWQELLSVSRKKLRGGAWDYLKENFDYPYYLLRDRLAGAEGTTVRSVAAGEGKVLRLNGQQVACSRDQDGKLTKVSAVCTHLGCLVRWNQAEQTWDCPCHGSRFTPSGKVIGGPAETPLEPIKPAAKKQPAR